MEKKTRQKRIVSVKTIAWSVAGLGVAIVGLLVASLCMLSFQFKNVKRTTEDYVDLKISAMDVQLASDYLTDQARSFVVTGEDDFVFNYFKEKIILTASDLENRGVQLRVKPVDPLRKLTINGEEKYEDIDFIVDYNDKRIKFPVVDQSNNTILQAKDTMEVVYTPNLEDTGIAIGYRAKRTNKDKQMVIKPNYIEYKV